MEPFKLFPQLGRFTLRYENKTVAVGKILKIIDPAQQTAAAAAPAAASTATTATVTGQQ